MHVTLSAGTLGALAALLAEQWLPSWWAAAIGGTLLIGAIFLGPKSLRWPVSLVSGVILLTLLPVCAVLLLKTGGETATLEELYSKVLWVLGVSAATLNLFSAGPRSRVVAMMGLASLLLITWITVPVALPPKSETMEELEWGIVRGHPEKLSSWITKALRSNVGPERLRHFCKLSGIDFSSQSHIAGEPATQVCRSVGQKFPERGAKALGATPNPLLARLAIDLLAEAGLWHQADRATQRAVKMGAPHSALNLWRWKAIKGRASKGVSTWEGWSSETRFDGPAGAERSAIRNKHAQGSLKPMIQPNGQRAVMTVNRYADSFIVSLPSPPPKKRVQAFRLKGQARSGFAFELQDANRQWHRYRCSPDAGRADISHSSFCSTSFGVVAITVDESIKQPLRLIRLRGDFILASVEASGQP